PSASPRWGRRGPRRAQGSTTTRISTVPSGPSTRTTASPAPRASRPCSAYPGSAKWSTGTSSTTPGSETSGGVAYQGGASRSLSSSPAPSRSVAPSSSGVSTAPWPRSVVRSSGMVPPSSVVVAGPDVVVPAPSAGPAPVVTGPEFVPVQHPASVVT